MEITYRGINSHRWAAKEKDMGFSKASLISAPLCLAGQHPPPPPHTHTQKEMPAERLPGFFNVDFLQFSLQQLAFPLLSSSVFQIRFFQLIWSMTSASLLVLCLPSAGCPLLPHVIVRRLKENGGEVINSEEVCSHAQWFCTFFSFPIPSPSLPAPFVSHLSHYCSLLPGNPLTSSPSLVPSTAHLGIYGERPR